MVYSWKDGRIFYVNNSWVTHGQSGELPFMGYSWIIHLLSWAFDEQLIYLSVNNS